MMIAHSKNFCICQLNYVNRTFYFLNEYRNGKPTTIAGEKAGKRRHPPGGFSADEAQRSGSPDPGSGQLRFRCLPDLRLSFFRF